MADGGPQEIFGRKLDASFSDAQEQPKLRSRRSSLEVRMDMLNAVRNGALGPTQIMYKANVSWLIVTQHLKELVGHGILSEHNIRNRFTYALTDKGISILRSYRLVMDQFEAAVHDGSNGDDRGHQHVSFDMR
jgi:predicted transcriptional regulator